MAVPQDQLAVPHGGTADICLQHPSRVRSAVERRLLMWADYQGKKTGAEPETKRQEYWIE